MDDKVRLSSNQTRALAAILSEKTIRDAAAKVGLTEKTLYKYLNDETFVSALAAAQDEITREAVNRLVGGLNTALDALDDLIKSGDPTNKRLAAVAWLTHALKLKEFAEIERRLNALEAKL